MEADKIRPALLALVKNHGFSKPTQGDKRLYRTFGAGEPWFEAEKINDTHVGVTCRVPDSMTSYGRIFMDDLPKLREILDAAGLNTKEHV